jgi:hypothetical protein
MGEFARFRGCLAMVVSVDSDDMMVQEDKKGD